MYARRRQYWAYLFILPFFASFLVFSIYPILYSLYLSFAEFDALTLTTKWEGLNNYVRLIGSSYFWDSVGNTVIIWLYSIIPQLTLATVLALFLNERWLKWNGIFRCVYYFPNLVASTTVGLLFNIMFSYPGGVINNVLSFFGLTSNAINFAENATLAQMICGIAMCWQYFGYNVIFISAGLHSISNDVYEAAEVDGASAFQRVLHITMPLLKPIMLYILITSIIGGLQVFDISKMLFRGSADYATRTMMLYMYESTFERWQFGFGAASSYGIFMIIGIFSLISILTINRKEKGEVK